MKEGKIDTILNYAIALGATSAAVVSVYAGSRMLSHEMPKKNLEAVVTTSDTGIDRMEVNKSEVDRVEVSSRTARDDGRVSGDGNGIEPESQKYSQEEFNETRNILYAEAANQPRLNRKIIARLILNRVARDDYPNTIHDVIFQKNAFSCIKDGKNKNWKQATGQIKMNEYEKMIFRQCGKDAKYILDGNKLSVFGVPRENEIIAYHDVSISIEKLRSWKTRNEKRKARYWQGIEEVFRNKRLIIYAPKKN
tara:strand:+ start:75 stop:827 length:753 start_codon:yes stop_codon:yes gene_type:complete